MKIAFDVSAQSVDKSGVGYYQYHLLKSLSKLRDDKKITLFGFNFRNYRRLEAISGQLLGVSCKFFKIPHRLILFLWIYFKAPSLNFLMGDHDIYQVSELAIPPVKKGKSVAFIHDLTTILFPGYHTSANIFLHKKRFEQLGRVDAILTNSQSTKADIVKYLGIDPKKIYVTYLAANERFKPLSKKDIEPILKKYNLKKPYLLFIGTLEPRKNLKNLIRAYEKLRKDKKINHQLVLVGQKGWKTDLIFKMIEGSVFKKDIKWIGYIEEVNLPALYNGADLFVYPSFYEGFGLPILEAMQCGVPVITSMVSSMSEVGGDACLYIDPHKVDQLKKSIYKVLSDKKLQKQLSKKGIMQAKNFSWAKCAQETLRVYKSLVGI